MKTKKGGILLFISLLALGYLAFYGWYKYPKTQSKNFWQNMTNPGPLSAKHAFLAEDCSSCHEPYTVAKSTNCISCHANNEILLKNERTDFHAHINNCSKCHTEHKVSNTTKMDHNLLFEIGKAELDKKGDTTSAENQLKHKIEYWVNHISQKDWKTKINKTDMLNCFTCHKNDDEHFLLFGENCSQCHKTENWQVDNFNHPSINSKNCNQCHQAPPSHYMMHFKKISQTIAKKPHAKVDQCYECHLTNAWTDIRDVGFNKHH